MSGVNIKPTRPVGEKQFERRTSFFHSKTLRVFEENYKNSKDDKTKRNIELN